jgi:sulfoxide reductase heme-binding subunit YedZ
MNSRRLITRSSIYIIPLILIIFLVHIFKTYNTDLLSDFGEIAFMLLFIILIIKPLSTLIPKLSFLKKYLTYRRELGIVIAYFAFAHGLSYLFYIETQNWNYPALGIYSGIFALIIMFLLYITSNTQSMIKLGRKWKLLHNFVYVIFYLTIAHVLLIKSFKGEWHYILFALVVIVLKLLEKKKLSK